MMVPLLALLAATTVSHSGVAQPLERLIPTLSSKWATPMRVEGPIAQEVALVSVQGITLEKFRAQTAEAFCGKWSEESGTWVLKRDDLRAREEEQAELALLTKRMAKAIGDFVGPNKAQGSLTNQDAEDLLKRLAELNERVRAGIQAGTPVGVDMGGTPQDRLMARTLVALNPGELAALPAASRIVFSTKPNRMQRPLPAIVSQHLAMFEREYGIWQSVAERYIPQNAENIYVDFGTFGPMKYRLSKLILVATKWTDTPAVSLELKVVDEKGNIVASTMAGLEATPPPDEETARTREGEPIHFSKDTLELVSVRTGAYRDPSTAQISEGLRTKVLSPEEHDPLSFGISEALLGIAGNAKSQLIACVPDSAYDLNFASTTMTPSQVQQAIMHGENIRVTEADGWIIVRPGWPHRARTNRTSRSQLGQLLRELNRSTAGSLGPLSKYASLIPGNAPTSITTSYLSMCDPIVASMLDPTSWELLRLYATLTPSQREPQERLKLRVADLDPKARAALHRLLFFSPNSVPMGAFQTVSQFEESGGEVTEPDLLEKAGSEPTEAMPNGIPENATFLIDGIGSSVAIAQGGGSYTAEDLGTQLAMRERPEIFPYVTTTPMPAKFRLAERTSILMTLGFNLEAVASFILNDHRSSGGGWVSIQQMPQTFREAVEKAKIDAREAFKGMTKQGSTGTGSNIPPTLPRS